tara:strand:+ start:908 stop:1486 length:579 start_codon:yes stop_codon:yes gene_type:complete
MGQFPTLDSFMSRGQTWLPTNTINPKSAWLFENRSGTLGTNLTGSAVYVGTTGTVRAIIAGTVGAQNTVTTISLISGGTGYTAATGAATTASSIVPASSGTGLTITTTVAAGVVATGTIVAAGINYAVGDIITIAGGGGNATFRVDSVVSLEVTAADAIDFVGALSGTILPVVVDYVLIPAANAAGGIVVGK